MKGIVLAGGTGSRLFPLTKITNKHLLPIYDKPMIYYPIQTLVDAGIRDILVVTGGKNSGDFLRLLANGKEFGLKHIDYTYQEGEGGIADALALAEHFADGDKICVILGDNIIEGSIRAAVEDFRQQERGAQILLKEVPDAERFGVAEIEGDRIVGIEEKPKQPKSNYAVTGIYMYDATVFDKIRTLVPSGRGELEITDVNNAYIREGSMTFSYLDGWWTDAGTFRFAAARRQPGGADAGASPGDCGRRDSMATKRRRIPRLPASPCSIPGCEKGIGAVITSPDSPDLIAGVRVRAARICGRTIAATFSKCMRMGRGLAAAFPDEPRRFRPRSIIPAPSRRSTIHRYQTDCWTPVAGMLQVALVDLREGSPTFGARNTLYIGALRPWQILIPAGRRPRLQSSGRRTGPAGLSHRPFLQPQRRRPYRLRRRPHPIRLGNAAQVAREDHRHRRRGVHRLGIRAAGAGAGQSRRQSG